MSNQDCPNVACTSGQPSEKNRLFLVHFWALCKKRSALHKQKKTSCSDFWGRFGHIGCILKTDHPVGFWTSIRDTTISRYANHHCLFFFSSLLVATICTYSPTNVCPIFPQFCCYKIITTAELFCFLPFWQSSMQPQSQGAISCIFGSHFLHQHFLQ